MMHAAAPATSCRASPCAAASLQQRSSLAFTSRTLRAQSAHLRRRQASARGTRTIVSVLDITTENFEKEVVQHWCGPCKLVLPSVEWAEREYGSQLKVVKVEADSNKNLVEKFKVYGLPTIILVKDGEEIAGTHHEGAITQAKLVAYLEKHGFRKPE